MENIELQSAVIKKNDIPISPISSAKTSYMDDGNTVYNNIKNMEITLSKTSKIELINELENPDIDIDKDDIIKRLEKLENMNYTYIDYDNPLSGQIININFT